MEDRFRICFIAYAFWPDVGGAQVRAEKQARLLQTLGYDVTVVTLRLDRKWRRKEIYDGLPLIRIGGIYRRDGRLRTGRLGILPIYIGMFLTLWHLRHSYDVSHVMQVSPLAAVATLIGKIAHKPVIISSQNAGPDEKQRIQLEQETMLMADTLTDADFLKIDPSQAWVISGSDITSLPQTELFGNAILNFLCRSNAFYQVLSTRSLSYLTSYGFRSEQIVYISGSVDIEKFRPAPDRRPDPAKPERDIICVARLEYSKGVDVLLHAWGRMMHAPAEWRAYLKPRLRLAGEGRFKPHMERIVVELNIQDSVEFLGLRTDIVDLLQQSWAFVMPSRWEGMPNALLEAMACSLPCLATRVSGSEDLISDGINGLLVEPEQPAEMAQALHCLIEDTDLAQRLGQAARETVVRKYQLISVVEQLLQVYRRLLLTKGENRKDAYSCAE